MVDEPAPGTGGGDKPWFEGYDADSVAHIQTRGWDKLSLKDAVAQAVKAHREAEKLIGVPQDQLLRFPKDANDKEAWSKIHARLGVPADPKEYDFAGVKFSDGTELDQAFADRVRGLATKYHLSKDDAKGLASDLVKSIEEDEGTETNDYAAKLAQEKDALTKNWGANYNANMIVAQNAAAKLGLTPEEVAALEKTTSYSRVMEMFRNVGVRMGEDKFINNGGGGGSNPMTKEQAQATLDQRQADSEWVKKLDAGDSATVQEFDNLTRLIAGVGR
jgi:hypothetical protein